jgi:hypothetical protein
MTAVAVTAFAQLANVTDGRTFFTSVPYDSAEIQSIRDEIEAKLLVSVVFGNGFIIDRQDLADAISKLF